MLEPETKSVIYTKEPVMRRKVISEETSKLVRYALESVVANGSGRSAYIENYRVGGENWYSPKSTKWSIYGWQLYLIIYRLYASR